MSKRIITIPAGSKVGYIGGQDAGWEADEEITTNQEIRGRVVGERDGWLIVSVEGLPELRYLPGSDVLNLYDDTTGFVNGFSVELTVDWAGGLTLTTSAALEGSLIAIENGDHWYTKRLIATGFVATVHLAEYAFCPLLLNWQTARNTHNS